MTKSSFNVSLKGADDIFSTEEFRQEQRREQVQQIPIGELFPFKNHPFKVKDDDSMMETADSIRQYGVLVPAIARPSPEGGYELIAGHRRHRASELAEKETMPVIVKYLRLSWQALHKITNKCCKEKGHGLLCHGLYHPFQI